MQGTVRAYDADTRSGSVFLDDGTVLDGVVDLAFADEGAGAWTVVDFKTDLGREVKRPSYEEQVRLYARAIAEATGRPARAMLLYV